MEERSRRRAGLVFGAVLVVGCGGGDAEGGEAEDHSMLRATELVQWLGGDEKRILVDLRAPKAFNEGHVAGSVNLQEGFGQFELRAKRFFGAKGDWELCLAAEDPAIARARAGVSAESFDGLRWLDASVSSLRESALPWRRQRNISAQAAHERGRTGQLLIVDARTATEYAKGHVPGCVFIYPDDFPRLVRFLRKDRPIAIICEEGWRSSLLVSWLDRLGFEQASNVLEGMKGWRERDLPLETSAEQFDFK